MTPVDPTRELLGSLQASVAPPRPCEAGFAVEPLLAELCAGSGSPSGRELEAMEALIKRVAVSRSLHACYDAAISRPAGDRLVHDSYAPVYCAGLLAIAGAAADWKFLNAA